MTAKTRFAAAVSAALILLLTASCASHLRQAKSAYVRGQELARAHRTGEALSAYKRAAQEAGLESRRNPSAQAFMVKGMAEASLELWRDAEASFLAAFGLGFEPGRAWASDASLLGLAVSFEELGLGDSATGVYERLLAKSSYEPVRMAAVQRYVDLAAARALTLAPVEKSRALARIVTAIDKLEANNYACGLYHYYHGQVESHRGDYRRSYEECVIARELGLPYEKVLRDNDNQIVFCYDRLVSSLPEAERGAFSEAHGAWAAKWGWKDARTPGWKKD